MEIENLEIEATFKPSEKIDKKLKVLLDSLRQRNLPDPVIEKINKELKELNSFTGSNKKLLNKFHKTEQNILEIIEKDLGLVPPDYHSSKWFVLGMSVFGLPLGTIMMAILDSSAFIAVGLPVGMAIGAFVGRRLDIKAKQEGKVLEIQPI